MENNGNQIKATADDAGAEKNTAAAGLGKFDSVEALLSAYQALEAEFTRRSQRLAELEKESKTQSIPDKGASSPKELKSSEELIKTALSNEEIRLAVVSDYLKSLGENRAVPLVTSGAAPTAPRIVPKSVKEAGALAVRFFNK